MSFRALLYAYLLGGVTFIPLVLVLLLVYTYYTSPDISARATSRQEAESLVRPGDEKIVLKTGTDELAERFHRRHESDVAAGYFAVCREYVPGGINGKPPDKLSPAGEVVAQDSPSVYQTMYRSIFDRVQKPTTEANKDNSGVTAKKVNNVFFVVLRHGVLMLYDDERQLEVRYVVSLEYHDVDIYGGGDQIPESELWIKRNCIRLTRRDGHATKDTASSRPFYLFSENLSQKEDFYFALLNNLTKVPGAGPPASQEFGTSLIISLVQRLHSTEEHMQTRWLNAMLGRYFLAMYKTPQLEAVVRTKLLKKIARVKKPSFITRLELQTIDMGNGAPFVTNPRLKDLDVNGNCVMEADIEYSGGFRVELGATIRIDLGTRLKAREVDIVLAATCNSLQGHLLAKFKPPPSNRVWITFEKLPKIDMSLEPIVSSRQITYTFILKQIESRILEVVGETIVLPFWDDISFLDTTADKYRGGIWKKVVQPTAPTEIKDEVVEDEAEAGDDHSEPERVDKRSRTSTMPDIPTANLAERVTPKKATQSLKDFSVAEAGRSPTRRDAPRMLRSPSFATTVDPMVSPSHAPAESSTMTPEAASKRDSMLQRSLGTPSDSGTTTPHPPSDAASSVPERHRAESNPAQTPEAGMDDIRQRARDSRPTPDETASTDTSTRTSSTHRKTNSLESTRSALQDDWRKLSSSEQAQKTIASIASAKEAAQKWGWGVLNRNRTGVDGPTGSVTEGKLDLSQPLGRGQPLPPPGQPLPRPPKGTVFALPALTKRKPATPQPGTAPLPSSSVDTNSGGSTATQRHPRHVITPHQQDTTEQIEQTEQIEASSERDKVPSASRITAAASDMTENTSRGDQEVHQNALAQGHAHTNDQMGQNQQHR